MEQAEIVKNNGNGLQSRFVNVLMSILTVALTGVFGFLWRMNGDSVRMQERDIEKDKKIDAIQNNINQMRLEQQVQKENVIRLDGKMDFLLQQQKK